MTEDLLMGWLRDAYAMEQALLALLDRHATDAEDEGSLEDGTRLRLHIEETRQHADRVEQCLKRLGTSPSLETYGIASIIGAAQSVMPEMCADTAVKNMLSTYLLERFEVGVYKALVAAADGLGAKDISLLCDANRREDEMMADWLESRIAAVAPLATAGKFEAVVA
jgi:ferritin-like metal-binding protein YciE